MIDVITDRAGVERLAEPWAALANRSGDPFQRHDCALASINVLSARGRPRVYVKRQGGDLQAIAAFHTVRRAGVTRLEMLTRHLAEPSTILHASEPALAEVVEAALGDRMPLMLGRLVTGGPELQAFGQGLERRPPLGTTERGDQSVWVPLPATADRLDGVLSPNRRRDLRRKWRRAEQAGAVTFSCVEPDAAAAPGVLEAAYRIEAASWKGRNGTALLMVPTDRRFFDTFGTSLAREGRLAVFFLHIGGVPAAMRICAVFGGRVWEMKIGYDEQFHDCSPGFLLTHETLRWCCGRGLNAYEFLGQAEAWEFAWGAKVRDYRSINIHTLSMAGAMSLAQDKGWEATKAGLRRIRMDRGARKNRARQGGATAAQQAPQPSVV